MGSPRARAWAPEAGRRKSPLRVRRSGLYSRSESRGPVREFFYGVILGAAAMYMFEYFDAPGVLAYLNSATESAVQSTHGYTR